MKITLASTSKYKRSILNRVMLKHDSIKPICEEKSDRKDPYEYCMDIASQKIFSIEKEVKEGIIIALDCIVLINNKISEKPKSIAEAKQNIKACSNNIAKVITGIAIKNQDANKLINDYQESIVYFKNITDDDIDFYLKNEPGILESSGFIIENIASNFIDHIDGSFYNVLGVPVEKIYSILNEMNIYLKDIN